MVFRKSDVYDFALHFMDINPFFHSQNLVMQHVDHSAGDLIDLLQALLRFDPSNRLTAREALRHPFFTRDHYRRFQWEVWFSHSGGIMLLLDVVYWKRVKGGWLVFLHHFHFLACSAAWMAWSWFCDFCNSCFDWACVDNPFRRIFLLCPIL